MKDGIREFYGFVRTLGAVCVTVALVVFTVALAIGLAFKILESL